MLVAGYDSMTAYVLLSNKISLKIFFGVVTSVLATGAAVAFWTHNETVTALANVLMVVVAVVYLAVRGPRAPSSNG
jgi:hypothetical protein